ncbi:MAG: hypothetical protein KatS3mg076_0220 [Candidatus Binatia bacterium]|nr:MAG: hypothetical protein KatS3mg076_0220 [Candidatus Binatia bacterium]
MRPRAWFWWFLVLGLVGCLTERTLRGVPAGERSWRIGYRDGCASARREVAPGEGWDRDRERYRVDDLYRRGWEAGYRECKAERRGRSVPSPTAAPEARSGAGERIERRIEALEKELEELRRQRDELGKEEP